MAKYDGLIIPRSYNDYINKSDPAGVSQALQLTGVMDAAPTAQSTKPAKSGGIFAANAVIMASSATLTGVAISAGSVVRVLFTAALTGSDATTGLTLTYNGNTYAVKVGKNGALANFLANNIDGSYIYCQAYTTLELMFDGTQFIIIGNPVVLSSADYTIYPDGTITYTADKINLFGRTIENYTGGTAKTILIGKTGSADVAKAYSNIEIIAGRVDGWLGIGWLFLCQTGLVSGKRLADMSNITFVVTQKDNQLYVYCIMDSYCNIICNIPICSMFTILNQEVSSVEGTRIWNNDWA